MVKRWEKMGRKPILKLGGSSKSSNCQPANSSGAGFRNLTQYADSDDGDEGNDRQVSSVGEPKKIDLEVADFLKEIDALAPNELPESSEAEAKDSVEKKDEAATPVDLSGDHSSSSTSGVQCLWQQCYDEQTGYTYFWNVQTNEVTWETPEDVKRLIGPVPSTSAGSSRAEHANGISRLMMPEDLSHHQPPKKRRKNRDRDLDEGRTLTTEKEGKIIPITCYGPSSSDEEEMPEVTVAIPKKRRLLASQQRKVKESPTEHASQSPSAQIGPHLPPELNSYPEPSPQVLESDANSVTLDSSTRRISLENGEPSDASLVSTCSTSAPGCSGFVEDGNVVTNGVSDHGEADPCCQSSIVAEDGPSVNTESQQPDSNSASELSPTPAADPTTSSGLALDDRLKDVDCDATAECVVVHEIKKKDVESPLDVLGLKPDALESSSQEHFKTEPDSTTRREGKRSAFAKNSEKRVQQNEALQKLLQYEETPSHSNREDLKRVDAEEPYSKKEEVDSADSPPELPAPSTVPVATICRSAKMEESQDPNAPSNIPVVVCGKDPVDVLASSGASSLDDPSEGQSGSGSGHQENLRSEVREKEEQDINSFPDDDELDLEEIEKALDSALERNKSVNSSVPSTSKSQPVIVKERSTEEGLLPPLQASNVHNDQLTVEDLSSLLFGKLAVLGLGKMDFSVLALLHVQLETRYLDWQLGHLSAGYLMERLKEADVLLKQYETKATPRGWTCNWDRENGRYFYMCNRTGRSQWEFPVAADDDEEAASSSQQQQTSPAKRPTHPSTAGQHPLVTSSTAEELFRFAAKGSHNLVRRIHLPKPVVQPPPPPEETAEVEPQCSSSPTPPLTSPSSVPQPPKSPPPPPPDSTEVEGKTPDVDMDIDDGNSKESEDNPSSSSVETSFQVTTNVMFLEREQSAFYEALGDTWLPETPANPPADPVAAVSNVAPSASTVSTSEVRPFDPGNCFAWIQPAAYGHSEVNGCDATGSPNTGGAASHDSTVDRNFSEPGTSSSTLDSGAGTSGIVMKKEKKKSKLATGLALKKKKISSLVEKWQKIKKEQLQEELTLNGDQDGKISTTM